ncbi:MAG: hypothetical protein HYZ22_20010 [Chloroflexi bacterium]|nr:hypothetical protein [Chloroflexota bacterium]
MNKLLLLTLTILLTACSALQTSEFDQNLSKWQDANIAYYRYDLFIGCFCPFYQDMPLTIEVKNGEVASIARADGTFVDASDPNYEFYVKYATIDRLFAELKSETAQAEEVVVTYDPQYGFPVNVSIDVIKLAMDDELSLQVTNFEVLK